MEFVDCNVRYGIPAQRAPLMPAPTVEALRSEMKRAGVVGAVVRREEVHWEGVGIGNKEEDLLVLSHTWGRSDKDGPDEAEKFLREYPGVTFIAGHSFHGEWERAADMAGEYPQLYLDLCAVMDDRGVLELFVERAGSHKILFGTDLPWFDPHYYIGAVLSADISDDARRDIFYRNGVRVLSRFSWFGQVWGDERI
ncbi:MAG: hypothetical protein DRP95_05120 [Candidatus Latescibacterota bacterium]|nr:MAG: hypothetical protein DRP95_05120 [Candidatus Latescibacterota bacterium]